MWLCVSSKTFWASSCGSSCPTGTVLSSWDFTVLSVSVLDWSDSELLAFPFPVLRGGQLGTKRDHSHVDIKPTRG